MRIAVLGGGVMGEALVIGLQRQHPDLDLVVAEKRADRAADLQARLGVGISPLEEACAGADAVIVVVKPQDVRAVAAAIAPTIAPGTLVISIAAGITTASLEDVLTGANVVRAMPNTPARIESGVTGISAGAHCDPAALATARDLLASVGTVIEVPESLQDAITSVSGSGPAYLFALAEGMLAGAREVGLDGEVARTAVVQTLLGAARLLERTGEDPAVLRANVTSPNGTTAAALAVFDAAGLQATIVSAIEAARDRSRELSSS